MSATTTTIPTVAQENRFKDVRVWSFPAEQWITIGRLVGTGDVDLWQTLDDDGFVIAPDVMTADEILNLMERASELAGV